MHARALHTVFQRINILVAKQEQNRHCACAAAGVLLVATKKEDCACVTAELLLVSTKEGGLRMRNS